MKNPNNKKIRKIIIIIIKTKVLKNFIFIIKLIKTIK